MEDRSIIYDGACTLCIRSKNMLLAWGIAKKDRVWAYQEMPDQYISLVDYERFRNEMALIDLNGGATLYGPDAIAYLLSAKSFLFRFLFSIGPLKRLFAFFYKIVALNRTAIMVPRIHKVRCTSCEPETPPEYRWFWIGSAVGIGILASIAMGVLGQKDLSKPLFSFGLLSLLLGFYLLIKNYKENYLEILAHAASLFLGGMFMLSTNFMLMDIFGGHIPLSIWGAIFAGIFFFLGKNYFLRAEFLQLATGEKILGAFVLAMIFLICYISLIF